MAQIFKSLRWFLLAPYFAVRSVPARPWFGESPEFARRINAQLALTTIFVWPLILLAPTEGRLGDAIGEQTYVFAALITVPTLWFVTRWLKGNRELHYAAAYQALPRWQRIVFGLTTPILMGVSLMLQAPNMAPRPPSRAVVCDKNAPQVTAEACYER